MGTSAKPLPIRRIAAYFIDYGLIVLWGAALFFVFSRTASDVPVALEQKLHGHLLAFSTLTVPVVLYFSLTEGLLGRSLGKAILNLRVVSAGRGAASFPRALLRNVVKFLPWEIAHAAIWYVPGQPFMGPMPPINLLISVATLIAALFYAAQLFVGQGRTLYDLVSGTQVVRNNAA